MAHSWHLTHRLSLKYAREGYPKDLEAIEQLPRRDTRREERRQTGSERRIYTVGIASANMITITESDS
jgi:hypothetical protein